jgi:hypothetical protein
LGVHRVSISIQVIGIRRHGDSNRGDPIMMTRT